MGEMGVCGFQPGNGVGLTGEIFGDIMGGMGHVHSCVE
jgi:hypothetical protein